MMGHTREIRFDTRQSIVKSTESTLNQTFFSDCRLKCWSGIICFVWCWKKCHLAQYNILVTVVCWSVVSVYSVVSAYYESLQHVALWNQTIFISTLHGHSPNVYLQNESGLRTIISAFFSLSSIVTLLDFTEQIGCIPLKHYPIYGVPG